MQSVKLICLNFFKNKEHRNPIFSSPVINRLVVLK